MNNMQLFENQPVRMAWDEEREEWYFSIVDVVKVLTEQQSTRGAADSNESAAFLLLCKRIRMTISYEQYIIGTARCPCYAY